MGVFGPASNLGFTTRITVLLAAAYFWASFGVNATFNVWFPTGRIALKSGSYFAAPSTLFPSTEKVAFNCFSESGVPSTTGAGSIQLTTTLDSVPDDGAGNSGLFLGHWSQPK